MIIGAIAASLVAGYYTWQVRVAEAQARANALWEKATPVPDPWKTSADKKNFIPDPPKGFVPDKEPVHVPPEDPAVTTARDNRVVYSIRFLRAGENGCRAIRIPR
jgi:hypothetical protein